MSESKGTSDEAIGRPDAWREGRYERAGKPVPTSVNDPAEKAEQAADTLSTPVTQKDYQQP
jgi:hypothetical protein